MSVALRLNALRFVMPTNTVSCSEARNPGDSYESALFSPSLRTSCSALSLGFVFRQPDATRRDRQAREERGCLSSNTATRGPGGECLTISRGAMQRPSILGAIYGRWLDVHARLANRKLVQLKRGPSKDRAEERLQGRRRGPAVNASVRAGASAL